MSGVIHVFTKTPGLFKELTLKCPEVRFQEIAIPETQEFHDDVCEQMRTAEILVADPPHIAPYIHKLPRLKWLQLTYAGVDALLPHCRDRPLPPYIITRLGGVFSTAMAEYVLSNIISNERRFKLLWQQQRDHLWKCDFTFRELSQLSLGILGLGDIGKCVAKYCKALGMTIWGMGRTDGQDLPLYVDEYRTASGLNELLQSCDYICNVLPSTPETKGLLSGDVLQACQSKQASFINIGRGDVIDSASIVKALKNGWISSATLDVFEEEPLPESSELWDMPGVTITPHCSGSDSILQVAEVISTNLKLFDQGKELYYIVDVKRGY